MSESRKTNKVVGIGASTAGLHSVKAFLDTLPPVTGSAFILVYSLDPAHDSLPIELLPSDTSLTIVTPVDGLVLQAEHLYVVPPDFRMAIKDGMIGLTAFGELNGSELPFDFLLRSISEDCGPLAVSIILSGTGTDGAEGGRTVENAGGLALIQDPQEATPDGMPHGAIARGIDPKILPIIDLAKAVIDYDPSLQFHSTNASENYSAAIIAQIIDLLNADTRNDFSLYKRGTLQRCVEKRVAMLGFPKQVVEPYIALLRQSPEERRKLENDLFINVTEFFRDRKVFDFVRDILIPEILETVQGDTVRVWVAGCSTGEEAYSLAILFLHHIETRGLEVKLQIFASDADADAVAIAREGRYSTAAVEPIPSSLLETYFTRDEAGYSVDPQLRESVVFTVHNLLLDPPFGRIDMVSCRNLLIYLQPEAQAKALASFSFALRESGILVIGKSETIDRLDDRFRPISMSERVYRRVGHRRPGEHQFKLPPYDNDQPGAARTIGTASRQNRLADIVSQALLRQHVPAAVLVDRQYQYLYSVGQTWKILQIPTGLASLDLFAITPRSLHNKIRSAIYGAAQSEKPFVVDGATIDINGARQQLSIHVELLSSQGEDFYLICFIEEKSRAHKSVQAEAGYADTTRASALEHELEEMRAELQGAIHNLEIADEEQRIITAEALSLSEEYQSTNRELVTSKEELQSLNEELTTVNNQLNEALERQRTISSDLEHVLDSTDVPTLFLDEALNIRFFTPATRLLFNIIPSDVGRPLSDLRMLVEDEDLRTDTLAVVRSQEAVEKEIPARNGSWFTRRIKPFKTEQGATEGVVITFIDTSAQKRIADDHEAAKKSAELATEAKSHFLAAASHDLRQPLQTLKLLHGLLEETVEGHQARLFIKRMEDTLASMSGILNTILDINQVEVGMVQPKPEGFYVADILERLRKEFSFQALGKGLELKVMNCGIAVHTDPQLLEQVLRNLLSNALKYTQTGKVLVGCRNRGKKLRVEIWDTGIGIPENQIEEIFNEYHQLDDPAGSRGQGLGLGLSIVKRLSDLLDLNVSACSYPGRGSVFSIEIGRAVIGQPLVSLPPASPLGSRRIKAVATILVIEDEESMRDLLRIGLEQVGHIVTATASATEALAAIRDARFIPQIILADYDLGPGMDGLAAIGEIRRILSRQIPALVLTGNISSDTLRKYAQYRVPHLNKPAKLRVIVSAIDDLLAYQQEGTAPGLNAPAKPDEIGSRFIDIIDDDPGVRESVRDVFSRTGWLAGGYASAEEYLSHYNGERASCLLVDAHLPGMGGMELLRILKERGHRFPIIVITGHSDVHMAVEAMKQGAVDFIEKPFSVEEIHAVVLEAFKLLRNRDESSERREKAQAILARLTQRQRQILERIVAGQPNKIIAAEMEISQRTVENHRASIMRRTRSTSLPALLRLVVAAEE